MDSISGVSLFSNNFLDKTLILFGFVVFGLVSISSFTVFCMALFFRLILNFSLPLKVCNLCPFAKSEL